MNQCKPSSKLTFVNIDILFQNSFLTSMTRYLRRGIPSSPADGRQSPSQSAFGKTLLSANVTTISTDQSYFKLVNNFVKSVLR